MYRYDHHISPSYVFVVRTSRPATNTWVDALYLDTTGKEDPRPRSAVREHVCGRRALMEITCSSKAGDVKPKTRQRRMEMIVMQRVTYLSPCYVLQTVARARKPMRISMP